MTALRPGASPPPVEMAIRSLESFLPHQRKHFTGRGMTPHGPLGKDQRLIGRDIEDTAGRRNHLHLGVGKRFTQLSRQTGGSGLVVSDDAILDANAHRKAFPLG
jgi:hypothetical protein